MWEANECIVRTHCCKHVQSFFSNSKLQGARAGNLLVPQPRHGVISDIPSVEKLYNGTARIGIFFQQCQYAFYLINFAISAKQCKKPWPIATMDGQAIVCFLFITRDIIFYEFQVVCLRKIPE